MAQKKSIWFEDYDSKLIHKFDGFNDDRAYCGISKQEDITIYGVTHTPFPMSENKIIKFSGEDFGYVCPECTYEVITPL